MANRTGALKMRNIAEKIKAELPEGAGFTLLVFEFNEAGLCNYISNADRESMIKSLEETAERLKKNNAFRTPEEN